MANKNIIIPATYQDIRIADQALHEMLDSLGVSDDHIIPCELAFHELLINLIDHAYEGDPTRIIEIELIADSSCINIQTIDSGKPNNLDLSAISMPDPLDLIEGGYGLAIILSQMDHVSYQTENNKNVWKLEKRFTGSS